MTALASDLLRHFRLLLQLLNRIRQNFTGSKILMSASMFVFFRPIGKQIWTPWSLFYWDIFDFSMQTLNGIRRNLTGSTYTLSSTKFPVPRDKSKWLGQLKISASIIVRTCSLSSFIEFRSAVRGEVGNISSNQRSGWPSLFSDRPGKHILGIGRWVLARCQASSNSIQLSIPAVAQEKSKMS